MPAFLHLRSAVTQTQLQVRPPTDALSASFMPRLRAAGPAASGHHLRNGKQYIMGTQLQERGLRNGLGATLRPARCCSEQFENVGWCC